MMPMTGHEKISRSAGMSGCAEKQATSIASISFIQVEKSREQRARMHASEDKIALVADSIAEGEGCHGTVRWEGGFGSRDTSSRHCRCGIWVYQKDGDVGLRNALNWIHK
jgi:hypothetical protein